MIFEKSISSNSYYLPAVLAVVVVFIGPLVDIFP